MLKKKHISLLVIMKCPDCNNLSGVFCVQIWAVKYDENGDAGVEFLSNLTRHTKAVNVVRFSPKGGSNMLMLFHQVCPMIYFGMMYHAVAEIVHCVVPEIIHHPPPVPPPSLEVPFLRKTLTSGSSRVPLFL